MDGHLSKEDFDEETIEKYRQIRAIASKNWLRGASVSLQQLDQVKSTVYNVGLVDFKELSNTRNKSHSQGQLNANPPLADLHSQRSAWGSHSSIPDLIKKNNARMRPESAKVKTRSRPPSGKKVRPHSAKDACGTQATQPVAPPTRGFGVKGAKYDPNDRPPKGFHHQYATTGWVAPPGGIQDVELMSREQIDNSLQEFVNSQPTTKQYSLGKLSAAYAEDSYVPHPPPPPRASPDILQMLREGNDSHTDSEARDTGNDSDAAAPVAKELLRRPAPEPIKFALPRADNDDDEEDEDEVLFTTFPREGKNNTSSGSEKSSGMDHSGHLENQEELSQGGSTNDSELSNTKSEPSSILNKDIKEGSKGKTGVTFNEAHNVTVSISPRDAQTNIYDFGKAAKLNKRVGRKDLRYVKSRTDTRLKIHSGKVIRENQGEEETKETLSAAVKPEQPDLTEIQQKSDPSYDIPDRFRHLVSNRPKSGKVKVAHVSLSYGDDLDKSDAENEKKKKMRKPRKQDDIPSIMSQIDFSDSEDEGSKLKKATSDGEGDHSRPGTAMTSRENDRKNYYEVARHSRPGDQGDVNTSTLTKTIKTMVLGDGELIEEKYVSVIDSLPSHRSEGQERSHLALRRPTSSKSKVTNKPPPRPGSRLGHYGNHKIAKELTADEKIGDGEVEVKVKDERSRSQDIPAPESTGESESEVHVEEEGEIMVTGQHTGIKKSHRPISAPAHRQEKAIANQKQEMDDLVPKPKVKLRPSSASTAMTLKSLAKESEDRKESQSAAKSSASRSKEARRANTALRFMREGYKGPSSSNSHLTNKKAAMGTDEEPEINEMWTQEREIEPETDGLRECRDIHQRLREKGIHVSVNTLKRALLPPGETSTYNFKPDPQPPNSSSTLLSHPRVWLEEEFKRLQLAKRAVRLANERMMIQEHEERMAMEGKDVEIGKKRKKRKKSGKRKLKRSNTVS